MDNEQLSGFLHTSEVHAEPVETMDETRELQEELACIREKGYSLNQETFLPGLISIGAPIFNLHTGKAVGGVSFDSSTTSIAMVEFERKYGTLLVELAKKITAAISFHKEASRV